MPPSRSKDVPFVVAYTYTGFPMVMLARELVHDGEIGEVRKVEAWYPQGWLATKLEAEGQKQASWRVDPGKAGALGLRRRHRHPRLRVRPVRRRPPGHAAPRPAQDVRPRPRPRRRLHRPGRARQRRHRHDRRLADHHRRPERQRLPRQRHDRHARMVDHRPHRPQALRRRPAAASSIARGPSTAISPARSSRTCDSPPATPKGFHEALANLHRTLEWTIRGRRGEKVPTPFEHPGIADGVAGMAFIEAAVASSNQDGAWVEVPRIG